MKLGPMNHDGLIWSHKVSGSVYYHEGRRFVLTDANEVYLEGPREFTAASDEDAARIRALAAEDQQIREARVNEAQRTAGGNDALESVLWMSMTFRDGEPRLTTLEAFPGIQFGQVGRNSTHYFYAGASEDGRKFYLAEDAEAERYGGERYSFAEIQNWADVGYWGHR